MSVPSSPLPSIVTDRYTIEREIGAGGMATVYLARDTKHDREVALKVLRPELGAVLGADRFLSEIKITARLDHPHILTLIDSGAADGLLYYVLPFVRGESLRDRLNRETQLPVDEALSLTKQVGSALDYAHRHGVIHRDIKPENILIQEGEAILTDFGIALAVKEAGGSRLTETGLSLGTPQYMSPEQATGDRSLGPKSDQYSLAAVLYEMLTGEPPLSGANSQAIIAKLLTEAPTRVRTVRKTVTVAMDAAIAKALEKSPADRFASIADFLRALDRPANTTIESVPASPATMGRRIAIGGGVAAAAVAALAIAAVAMKSDAPESAPIALRDRTQLTFSGSIQTPALSRDAKQIAYFLRTCPTEKCTYEVNVQDVGNTEARKILDGLSAGYSLEWSPDRRNLLFVGTYNGRFGSYIVSALGGRPRLIGSNYAAFYADGDSLLVASAAREPDKDSTFSVKITGLSGDVGGTLKVPGGGNGIFGISAIPGSSRILVGTIQSGRALWQVVDRQGNTISRLVNACTCGGLASSDAVWMARAGAAGSEAIVRVAMDPKTGKFLTKQDTVYGGRFSGFSVSADGTQLMVDDGSVDYNVVYGSLADFMAKKIPDKPQVSSSTRLNLLISPDGSRLLKRQAVPDGKGNAPLRLSWLPFNGGTETPIEADGKAELADWADSVTVWMATQQPTGLRFSTVDIRNGARGNVYDFADSTLANATAMPGGWVIIPATADRLLLVSNGNQRVILKPSWYQAIVGVAVSRDAARIMYWGWNAGSNDSTGYEVMSVEGGPATRVFTQFGEASHGAWMFDGSFLARVWDTPDAVTLWRIRFPGGAERIGTVPHRALNMSVSADGKSAVIGWRNVRADAFLYRVAKE